MMDRIDEIRRLLLEAYDAGKRNLPWREETDPYRIWVSEVMLQQTRVETVLPYYKAWVKQFPDLETLATAQEEEVLRAWQGLGYYSRARRLWNGAKVVRERLHGRLPETQEGLLALPGIGRYTAGAVASIAFGEVVPAVDGNVRRVLSRLFDLPDPGVAELHTRAGELVDSERPGDFNQALMEHGALVCTPRSPGCAGCSLEKLCRAREAGTVNERPARKVKKAVPSKEVLLLVAVRDDPGSPRLLLQRRPDTGLLAGMWEFPGLELGEDVEGTRSVEMRFWKLRLGVFAETLGIGLTGDPTPLTVVTHEFTHLKIRYRPFIVQAEPAGRLPVPLTGEDVRWVNEPELDALPLPVAQGKIAAEAFGRL